MNVQERRTGIRFWDALSSLARASLLVVSAAGPFLGANAAVGVDLERGICIGLQGAIARALIAIVRDDWIGSAEVLRQVHGLLELTLPHILLQGWCIAPVGQVLHFVMISDVLPIAVHHQWTCPLLHGTYRH